VTAKDRSLNGIGVDVGTTASIGVAVDAGVSLGTGVSMFARGASFADVSVTGHEGCEVVF